MSRAAATVGVAFLAWFIAAQFGRDVRRVTVAEARAIIDRINARDFAGSFDPVLVLAIIQIESGFDAAATRFEPSRDEASIGLMQLLYSTARDRGLTDGPAALFDPGVNILLGMRHLAWSREYLRSRLGREPTDDEWIGSYNAGVGNVSGGFIPRDYVRRARAARTRFT